MPPPSRDVHLSPAELSYLQTSLASTPPIRPDGRIPTQFRPLVAESDILPGANGSARTCFADGTEAIVGVKAEIERSSRQAALLAADIEGDGDDEENPIEGDGEGAATTDVRKGAGKNEWVTIAIDIPGYRDDDALPVFLSAMLTEALLATGDLTSRLYISNRHHWRLYIDILLLSPPLSYPLPLLSITTHLALLSARLPQLISEKDEDPLFNDDWSASTHIYPLSPSGTCVSRPPITLLVICVGDNLLYDPSREELAVADAVLAVSVGTSPEDTSNLRLLSIRNIDTPARLSHPGLPDSLNATTNVDFAAATGQQALDILEKNTDKGVWRLPRGGFKRGLLMRVIDAVLRSDGVAVEVLDALGDIEVS